jgi:hypothetical protein
MMPGETLAMSRAAQSQQKGTGPGRYVTAALLAVLVVMIFLYTIFTRL